MGIITTALLDNDGVLVDTEPLYFEANRQILARFGITLTPALHQEHNLQKGKSVFDFIKAKYPLSSKEEASLIQERNAIYLSLITSQNITREGAKDFLTFLKKKSLTIGIVTSSRRDIFLAIHQKTGFLPFFDFVIDRESVFQSKPSPEPYVQGLKAATSTPAATFAVEDSFRGLMAAKKAGLPCYIVKTTLTANQDFSEAEKVFSSLPALQHYLERVLLTN